MTDLITEEHDASVPAATRAAIDKFYEAFSGKPELLDEAVTPDWQDIPLAPGQAAGREGMKPLIRRFNVAFPDAMVIIHDVIEDRGRVAVRAEITGTHRGEWFGVPPSGRSFSLAVHEFHHIANGRLTHTWHLEDWFGWLNQVNAWPHNKDSAS